MAAGALAGLLKEAGDVAGWWPGALSARDLGADAVGVALGAAACVAAEAQGWPAGSGAAPPPPPETAAVAMRWRGSGSEERRLLPV